MGIPFFVGILHGHFFLTGQNTEKVSDGDAETRYQSRYISLFGETQFRSRNGVSHRVLYLGMIARMMATSRIFTSAISKKKYQPSRIS